MKGLLYKDFVTVFTSFKANFLLVMVLYIAMGLLFDMPYFVYLLIVLLGMYAVSTLNFDETSQWDIYARTLPVTAGQLVGSKYLLGGVLVLAGTVLTVPLMMMCGTNFAESFVGCISCAAGTLLYHAVNFPIQWKFGSAKSRTWLIVLLVAVMAGVIGVTAALPDQVKENLLGTLNAMSNANAILLFVGVLAAALAVYVASWAVSVRIYRAKTF